MALIADNLESEKPVELIEEVRGFESKSQELQSFFSEDEIRFFKHHFEKASQIPEFLIHRHPVGTQNRSNTMVNPKGQAHAEIKAHLNRRLKEVLDQPFEVEFSFHKNYVPYDLHTDSGYDPEELIYRQGLIPLDFDPPDREVYTIIMNERCYHSSSFPEHRMGEIQADPYGNFRNEFPKITDADIEKYWAFTAKYKTWLKNFSIDLPFKWRVGNMALWDRSKIHCSNDFIHHGTSWKLGLMWVSRLR